MNAYELAQELHEDLQWIVTLNTDLKGRLALAINMLRQQADRIAELEKEAEECWCQGHSYEYLRAKNRLPQTKPAPEGLIDPKSYYIGYEDGKKAPQTKPLSDEEIHELIVNKVTDYELCRAIEKRHGIK